MGYSKFRNVLYIIIYYINSSIIYFKNRKEIDFPYGISLIVKIQKETFFTEILFLIRASNIVCFLVDCALYMFSSNSIENVSLPPSR